MTWNVTIQFNDLPIDATKESITFMMRQIFLSASDDANFGTIIAVNPGPYVPPRIPWYKKIFQRRK